MAQHSYFNLDVPGTNKTILDHDVFVNGYELQHEVLIVMLLCPTPLSRSMHSQVYIGALSKRTLPGCRSFVTPTDSSLIPTGEFEAVEGTAFDFLLEPAESFGSRLDQTNNDPLGYDINYVLWGLDGPEAKADTHDCVVFNEYALELLANALHVQGSSTDN